MVDAQRDLVAVEDVEHVEECARCRVRGGTSRRCARCRPAGRRRAVRRLRPLKGAEEAGGAALFLEDDLVFDPGLGKDEVVTVGRLLVGSLDARRVCRHSFV